MYTGRYKIAVVITLLSALLSTSVRLMDETVIALNQSGLIILARYTAVLRQ